MKTNWIGVGLIAAPLVYAGVMVALRRAWTSPPSPLSAGEGELVLALDSSADEFFYSKLELEELAASSPSPAERGLGGEVFKKPRFSVLIAARNEAATLPHLLHDLNQQTLPAAQFEVIVVDDHSTDATAAVASQTATDFPLHLIQLAQQPGAPTGKKAALQAALAVARAPWVVCTDADCRLGPDWLRSYVQLIQHEPAVRFISGPVLLTGPDTVLHRLMGLEFAGLVGVGGACIQAGFPTMCNGANLAYRRDSFAAVQGFVGNEHLASGDDEFLLHKLHAAYPGSIRFLQAEAAVVRTAAPPTLSALLRQRVRWASKWRHYQATAPQRLAVLVLLANVSLAAGPVLWLQQPGLGPWVGAAWALKLGADVWFLRPVLRLLHQPRWLRMIPLLQLAYAPYTLGVGLLGLRGGYQWKGRQVK
ncbi:glycosyltransferase [Hymenobacter sp. BT507]|uniref:Glycosyltransferase n=1 Tax=Hymenobacter citatus TaxID=2763506 RepID=A0ABR7MQC4_9BACT|nr:glycosyltransferase [Hymenobacter citatus]MBC6613280.1 glycosyltransferase [Hymenobacter citatus]